MKTIWEIIAVMGFFMIILLGAASFFEMVTKFVIAIASSLCGGCL